MNNSHNCTDVDQLMKRYYLPIAYGIIFFVGLVGNVTSIAVYLMKLRPWKSSSIIMVNLALTDLLYILSMPFLIYYYSNGDSWTLGDFMCRFVRFGFHINLYGSVLCLTCLAVFCFVVVAKPLRAAQMQQRCWGITACVAVWVIAAAEITPMLAMITMEEHNNKTYCLDFASTKPVEVVWWYGWLLTALGFLLPLVVVFMCYIGVAKKLANGPRCSRPSRTRARHVTMMILAVFVMCFLPYHILRVLRMATRRTPEVTCVMERSVHAAYIISRPLAAFNTFFNLALYTLSGDKFRQAFFSTFYQEHWFSKARSLLNMAIINKEGSDMPAE
ncbi:hypothetical protein LDENG_00090180 [Lucifuga dentata]|nr:hypothetical protein LDENG_00090180 [Lucifuga dentata]